MNNENNPGWSAQSGRVLFTLVLFVLAGLHTIKQFGFDTISVSLGVVAVMPWILPELFGMISSLSVTGLFDVKFKEMQQTIAQQEQKIDAQAQEVNAHRVALDGGVGGIVGEAAKTLMTAVGGAVSQGAAFGEATGMAAGDPKGKYGGNPSSGSYRLRALVKPFPGSNKMFLVHTWVEVADARHLPQKVIFDVGPTFPEREVEVTPDSDGIASLDRAARGAFTIGAKVFWGPPSVPPVRLELDLATDVSDAPATFLKH